MCDDTHIDRGTHHAALQQIEALEAAVEQAQRTARYAQQNTEHWKTLYSTAIKAINDLAVETAEGDDDTLDSTAWRAILALDGVVDPRTTDVTITFTATRTMTAEITVTLSGVRRSTDLDAVDAELDCADVTNRRDVEYGLSILGIEEYEAMSVEIGYNSDETEIEDVSASFD